MSIVPYAANRQIVLRHNDSVVLYDPQSKRFGVSSHNGLDLPECPYCHQPLRRDNPHTARNQDQEAPNSSLNSPGFVSPEYFRMLQDGHPNSATTSSPPSPVRRLVEPGRATDSASKSPEPPEYFENVGASRSGPSKTTGISSSAFSQGYFQRFFVVERELGRGGKGVVLLVTHILDNVDLGQYACKRVPVGNDHAWLTNVLGEVRLLVHLSHQNLVYYKHVWLEEAKISKFGPSVPCAFILQQYCNGGDLHRYIVGDAPADNPTQTLRERKRRKSKNQFDPPKDFHGRKLRFDEIYSFFKNITSGLNHLHVNGFIHRDLKPSNCLLHDSGQGIRVLVSDFGEVQTENVERKSSGATGTVSYCAPEVLRRDPDTGVLGNFSTKSDIFSLGMILYFLCFARLPYRNADLLHEENEDLDLLKEEIIGWSGLREERKLRPELPEQLYTFLRRLLSLDPEDRPSAEEILLGIKTGSGLDSIADARPNKASHMFDDLSASSRISPVDSPRPATPVRRSSAGFLRSSTGRRKPSQAPIPSPLTRERSTEERRDDAVLTTSSESDTTPSGISKGESMILRGRTRLSSSTSQHQHHNISSPPPPALPEPPRASFFLTRRMRDIFVPQSRIHHYRDAQTQKIFTIKLLIFLVKAVSLHLACAPVAVQPSVMYALLALATLDFLVPSSGVSRDPSMIWSVMLSVLLAALHVGALVGLRRDGGLCLWQ